MLSILEWNHASVSNHPLLRPLFDQVANPNLSIFHIILRTRSSEPRPSPQEIPEGVGVSNIFTHWVLSLEVLEDSEEYIKDVKSEQNVEWIP